MSTEALQSAYFSRCPIAYRKADTGGGPPTASAGAGAGAAQVNSKPPQQGNSRVIGKDAANAGSRIRPSSKRGPRPERTGAGATQWPAGQKERGIHRVFMAGWPKQMVNGRFAEPAATR